MNSIHHTLLPDERTWKLIANARRLKLMRETDIDVLEDGRKKNAPPGRNVGTWASRPWAVPGPLAVGRHPNLVGGRGFLWSALGS